MSYKREAWENTTNLALKKNQYKVKMFKGRNIKNKISSDFLKQN